MERPETISKTVDYNAELVRFKSHWGEIPEGLALDLGHFYATSPIRVREMAWIEKADFPEQYYHAVNGLANYCSSLVSMKSSPSEQKRVLVDNTLKYMLQEESRREKGGRLLDFLQSLGWPYDIDDINPVAANNFKEKVLAEVQFYGPPLPVAEKSLAIELIKNYTDNIVQTTGKAPKYHYCSPDVFSVAQVLRSYGFRMPLQTWELDLEAKHLCKQMEDCGNTKGLAGLRKAMVKEPDKWIYERYK